jgi:hypothetical protein
LGAEERAAKFTDLSGWQLSGSGIFEKDTERRRKLEIGNTGNLGIGLVPRVQLTIALIPEGIPGIESAKCLFFGVEAGEGWHGAQYSKMPS